MRLDFRTKFFMTLVISTVCVTGNIQYRYPMLSYSLSALPFILVLTEKKYGMFLRGIISVTVATILVYFIQDRYSGIPSSIALLLSGVVLRMMPGIMMGYYAVISTSMSDMVESLRRLKLPDFITIPISVMFRFFYSIREDYYLINDAMKMHGLTMKRVFIEPVRIVEYKVVPLLMCSTRAADDITISAMTRGMRVGGKRSSISDTKLRMLDYVVILLMLALILVYGRTLYA